MTLNINSNIHNQLEYFNNTRKIPNIIIYGPSGGGKRTFVNKFIKLIYNNDIENINTFVMYENCSNGKGIQFVREDIKFFSKTNINNSQLIKTIILSNADKLTIDAQTALRRSIEIYSITTRFILIVEDKNKLINPIISRFCELYIPLTLKYNNLHKYFIDKLNKNKTVLTKKRYKLKLLLNNVKIKTYADVMDYSSKLYEKGFSSIDVINYIKESKINNKDELILLFSKTKNLIRNEKLQIAIILNNLYLSSNISLENVLFM